MKSVLGRRITLAVAAVVLVGIGAVGGMLLTWRAEPVGHPVDVGFSQDMIVHHQQAVDLAEMVRGRASPVVANLAASIAANQLKEIGQLQGWLSLWNAPQVGSGAPMAWMALTEHGNHQPAPAANGAERPPMPGLASVPELHRLQDASGKDMEVWFLQLMIRHHQGGLQMASAAAQSAHQPQVKGMATLVVVDQQREIATMTELLTGLGQQPLPSP